MLLEQGWLVGARRVPSPHYDCRPDDETPTLLVVHNISLPPGEFGGPWIDALFTGTIDPQAHPFFAEIAHLRVSAHCLIRRDGFSIGIELEGTDTLAYTDAQYQQLAAVTRALIDRYPDIANNMTGHCDIAPDRKTDPGPAFDWARFRALVSKETT